MCMYAYIRTVIKAERVSNDSVQKGYVFPDEDDNLTAYTGGNARLMVSSSLLQNISKYGLIIICTVCNIHYSYPCMY